MSAKRVTGSIPGYLHHKSTGQARVRIDGRDFYLGPYGSDESRRKYGELIAAMASGVPLDPLKSSASTTKGSQLTLSELCLAFMRHAVKHYRKNGQQTTEVDCLKLTMRPLLDLYGETPVEEFGPLALKAVRQKMIDAKWVRASCNKGVNRIRLIYRWAVENELVTAEALHRLEAVAPLLKGRTEAKDNKPVLPVDQATVDATLPYLSSVVADMVRVQLLAGCRPSEVCSMRPCDFTRGVDGIWIYRPATHKTEHHDKERRIYIGPEGQAILMKYMGRDAEAHCFSPAEAEAERNRNKRTGRKSPMTPSQLARQPKGKRYSDRYDKDSYNRAIQRGCELAFGMRDELRNVGRTVARMTNISKAERELIKAKLNREAAIWREQHCWSPNRLRHTRGTVIRAKYGIEASRVTLGHSDVATTEIYAEADWKLAEKVAREIG